MAADPLGLFKELCYVEYSHPEHSPGAGGACGGRRASTASRRIWAIQGAVLCGVLASEHSQGAGGASGGRRGIPMSRSGAGHFLTVPTGVHSRGRAGRPVSISLSNTDRGQIP
jgi:hypothetical protein